MKYNLSGKYFFVGFPSDPGSSIAGFFERDTSAGLVQGNITLFSGDGSASSIGQSITFDGTYLYQVIADGIATYGDAFTISGTVIATSSAELQTSPAPEPANTTLIDVGIGLWIGSSQIYKRRGFYQCRNTRS